MTATDPDSPTPVVELQELLQFFYQCPVGLIEIDERGAARRINPAAARMLTPALHDQEDLTDLHAPLARLCPELLAVITGQPERLGPLHPGRRIVVEPGGSEHGQVELRAVRVDRDRVMLACSDVTEEQRLARRTLALAARLRDVVAATSVYRSAAAANLHVSVSAVMALEELLTRGPRTPGAIARRLDLTPTTLTTTIDQLEHAGLVNRTPNPRDRRSLLITLVPGVEQRIAPVLELLIGGADRVAEEAATTHENDTAAILDALTTALRTRAAVQVPRTRTPTTDQS